MQLLVHNAKNNSGGGGGVGSLASAVHIGPNEGWGSPGDLVNEFGVTEQNVITGTENWAVPKIIKKPPVPVTITKGIQKQTQQALTQKELQQQNNPVNIPNGLQQNG